MSKIETYTNLDSKSLTYTTTFGSSNEYEKVIESIKVNIIDKVVDLYIKEFGEEILSSIDLETIKKKTNDKVTVKALKELVK